jgi:hypothetical protein
MVAVLLWVAAAALLTSEVHADVDGQSTGCGYDTVGTLFDPVAGTPLWDLPPSPEIGPCAHEAARRLVIAEAAALSGTAAATAAVVIVVRRRAADRQ